MLPRVTLFLEAKDAEAKKRRGIARFSRDRNETLSFAKNQRAGTDAWEHLTAIPGLSLYHRTSPTPCFRASYEPGLCIFAQGRKRILLGGTEYLCDSSSFLLSSIDVPAQSQIIDRQKVEGWGTKVIERLAKDLGTEFPGIEGFSPRNLKYMRAFAEAWPEKEFVRQAIAQLPWG